MWLQQLTHKIAALVGVGMIVAGLVLAYFSIVYVPTSPIWRMTWAQSIAAMQNSLSPLESQNSPLSAPKTSGNMVAPARILLTANLPMQFVSVLTRISLNTTEIDVVTPPVEMGSSVASRQVAAQEFDIVVDYDTKDGLNVFDYYFAATVRLTTITPELTMDELTKVWQLDDTTFAQTSLPVIDTIIVVTNTLPALQQIMGEPGRLVRGVDGPADVSTALFASENALAIIPFDSLTPDQAVIPIDGQNPVENGNLFNPEVYPLVAHVYAHGSRSPVWNSISAVDRLFATLAHELSASNRNPDRLTVIVITGVTAMVRLMAEQMDRLGNDWPAAAIGDDLASADITVISNEVPFVSDCETNTDLDNLVFCSKPEYIEALHAMGVDIVGLTGNHQNDYGVENALASLEFYEAENVHTYGGGATLQEARKPFVISHNGNRLAFLGANSYGPPSAWATELRPGSAPFDLNIMSAQIRSLQADGQVDVVLAELQYQETYDTQPLIDQRQDFTALVRAGADIVTGVQSHVPQGIELFEGRLILYGLGNLLFDQMWSEATRQALVARHTIYDGRHISTQLLPTMLHDYGQPQWATEYERSLILRDVFAASYGP